MAFVTVDNNNFVLYTVVYVRMSLRYLKSCLHYMCGENDHILLYKTGKKKKNRKLSHIFQFFLYAVYVFYTLNSETLLAERHEKKRHLDGRKKRNKIPIIRNT